MNPPMPCADSPRRAYLFTNHSPSEIVSGYHNIRNEDYVVAVDMGLERIHQLGLSPNLIVGDLDSVNATLLALYPASIIQRHPAEKNATDTELAILTCIKMNCFNEIIICNTLDGRFDHALAIVQNLLEHVASSIRIRVETESQVLFFISSNEVLARRVGQTISLVPFTPEVVFSSSEGLKYPLNNLTILQHQSRGISNVICSNPARIIKQRGEALAIITISN
jgi:thiamine pyrophosphokinase